MMFETHICPLCGDSGSVERYEAPLPIRDCACGLTFIWPRPTMDELNEIYTEEYYKSWGIEGEDDALPRAMKHLTFAYRLRKIAQVVRPGKVLDVGCATGYFLEVASRFGWEVTGVELSAYSARLAASKFGERVFNGSLEEAAFPDASFDMVTLSDLLEHIPDPLSFLREVRRILKPGGGVMIVTPNVDSLTERVMRGKWSHYKGEHLFYFSPLTIRACLEKSGFAAGKVSSAPKYLNLAYVLNQFTIYPHPVLTPLLKMVDCLIPERLKKVSVPIRCGEMMVLATKAA